MMLLDMIVITLVCWMIIGLLTFGRKKVLSMIPLFRDNTFDEKDYEPDEVMYMLLKLRREATDELTYKYVLFLVVVTLIPIVNFFIGILLFGWMCVLILTDIFLAVRYGLQKLTKFMKE